VVEFKIKDKNSNIRELIFHWNPNVKIAEDSLKLEVAISASDSIIFTISKTEIIALANAVKVKGAKA